MEAGPTSGRPVWRQARVGIGAFAPPGLGEARPHLPLTHGKCKTGAEFFFRARRSQKN